MKRRGAIGAVLLAVVAAGAGASTARAEEAPAASTAEPPPAPIPTTSPAETAPPPEAPPAHDDLAALRADLAAQGAAIEALEARAHTRDRAPIANVHLSGYVQIDWVIHSQASQDEVDDSTGLPINQDRFTLRRGHLRLDVDRGPIAGALEIDANTTNGPQVRPIDAEVAFRWPPPSEAEKPIFVASLGLMKIPFGFEVPELDNVRPFLERSTVMRALFPGEFDLGARLSGGYRSIEWAIALMNGNPIGDAQFPDLAPGKTKELVARLGAHADLGGGVLFEAGVSGDTGLGFHEGTPTTKDVVIWRDDNGDGIVQATEIGVIPGMAATPSQQFRRFAVGADARLTIPIAPLGALAIRAELARAQNLDRGVEPADPVGAGYDLRELGWYVGATQELTRWAMVGVRYDRYDPDQDAREEQAANVVPVDRTYRTLALMAMARYEGARLLLEYDHNGNALGRDASGAPATLRDDALILRGQVAF
ncbi:MAG TPA: hypothetical protein VHV30_09920 [Polyangiaceae bacterium]|jgi:hypothetical protein|nr:hypothetical protein [Polyangiaceae bacterium]